MNAVSKVGGNVTRDKKVYRVGEAVLASKLGCS